MINDFVTIDDQATRGVSRGRTRLGVSDLTYKLLVCRLYAEDEWYASDHDMDVDKEWRWQGAAQGAELSELGIAEKRTEKARLFHLWWTQYAGKEISENALGISRTTAETLFNVEHFKLTLKKNGRKT